MLNRIVYRIRELWQISIYTLQRNGLPTILLLLLEETNFVFWSASKNCLFPFRECITFFIPDRSDLDTSLSLSTLFSRKLPLRGCPKIKCSQNLSQTMVVRRKQALRGFPKNRCSQNLCNFFVKHSLHFFVNLQNEGLH